MSVSTFAENKPTGQEVNGAARLRVWSRSSRVTEVYRSQGYVVVGSDVWRVRFTLKPSDTASGRELFTVTGSDPPDKAGGSVLPLVVYDILNFFQIPTNIISAFVNNLFVGSISTSGMTTNTAEKTIKAPLSGGMDIDLPEHIFYDQADVATATDTDGSGLQVHFLYELSGAANPSGFTLEAGTTIEYVVLMVERFTGNSYLYWVETRPAIKTFVLNPYKRYAPVVLR